MYLVNQTAAAAMLLVSELSGEEFRGGVLVAKATFELPRGGAPRLVWDDPMPLFDRQTPCGDLGDLPADLLPREDPGFEVILLGACHAPGGKPTRQQQVSLSVGGVTRSLLVTGDRVWEGSGAGARISAAAEFTRLPLTYEHAFGGRAEIQIDPHSLYPVSEPLNPRGRGFDASDYVAGCAAAFECPPGFPALAPVPRQLPNVEDARQLIRTWSDHPEPCCWATIPTDVGFALRTLQARLARHGAEPTPAQQAQAGYFRAHPDWIFDGPPPARAQVRIDGMAPDGAGDFALPPLRVLGDYEIGQRQGVLELAPQVLILLPEQRRFCLLYRSLFRFREAFGQARSFRLRLVEGWHAP